MSKDSQPCMDIIVLYLM